jgi:hypothetical protein
VTLLLTIDNSFKWRQFLERTRSPVSVRSIEPVKSKV